VLTLSSFSGTATSTSSPIPMTCAARSVAAARVTFPSVTPHAIPGAHCAWLVNVPESTSSGPVSTAGVSRRSGSGLVGGACCTSGSFRPAVPVPFTMRVTAAEFGTASATSADFASPTRTSPTDVVAGRSSDVDGSVAAALRPTAGSGCGFRSSGASGDGFASPGVPAPTFVRGSCGAGGLGVAASVPPPVRPVALPRPRTVPSTPEPGLPSSVPCPARSVPASVRPACAPV
jgi:hypothetical protein